VLDNQVNNRFFLAYGQRCWSTSFVSRRVGDLGSAVVRVDLGICARAAVWRTGTFIWTFSSATRIRCSRRDGFRRASEGAMWPGWCGGGEARFRSTTSPRRSLLNLTPKLGLGVKLPCFHQLAGPIPAIEQRFELQRSPTSPKLRLFGNNGRHFLFVLKIRASFVQLLRCLSNS
jgi:hypothetical protein